MFKFNINQSIKTTFVLILLFTSINCYSQDKTRFSILAGPNFQNLNGKTFNGDASENTLVVGFHAGFNIAIPVAPEFYFQPGLLFSTKGGKHTTDSFTNKISLSYLEVPLNLVYRAQLGQGYFLLGFGPYIAYGLMGKRMYERNNNETKSDIVFNSSVESGNPDDMAFFKRFDAGGNIFAGYETSAGIFCHLNTQLGMLKINPEYTNRSNDKSVIKNTGFGLSVGYRF